MASTPWDGRYDGIEGKCQYKFHPSCANNFKVLFFLYLNYRLSAMLIIESISVMAK